MITRVLPPEEWHRASVAGLPLLPGVPEKDVSIVAVESEGRVVACLTVFKAPHFEGLWIDPEHRNAGVSRGLMDLAEKVVKSWGNEWVFAAAEDERMRTILGRVGAVKLPIDSYVMSLGD